MNKKTIITIAAAAAFGLIGVFLVNSYITNKERALYKGMEMVPIVVITQDTAAGKRITPNMIAKRNVPQKYVDTNAVLAKDYALLIGQTLVYPLKRGDAILWSSLASEAERLNPGMAGIITKGERALSVAVGGVAAVSGFIKPNDHIDILMTVRDRDSGEEATITLLQNMTVLAAGQQLDVGNHDNRKYSSLTLLVTLEEAELLVFAQQKGQLVTVLRNPEDINTREDIPKITFSDILKDEFRKNLQEKRDQIEIIKKGKTEQNVGKSLHGKPF
jgi:pilus assembly protein CpaB